MAVQQTAKGDRGKMSREGGQTPSEGPMPKIFFTSEGGCVV